jgi:hypothetical protein
MMNVFLKQGEEFDQLLETAEKKPEIRDVLRKYCLDLSNGGLSVSRGEVAGRNTNTLDQITDIYWRLKASGAGEDIAKDVVSNAKYLTMYLEMKADDVSDVSVAEKLMALFYK